MVVADDRTLDEGDIRDVLRNDRRRIAIEHLRKRDGRAVSLGALSERVASRETGEGPAAAGQAPERVRLAPPDPPPPAPGVRYRRLRRRDQGSPAPGARPGAGGVHGGRPRTPPLVGGALRRALGARSGDRRRVGAVGAGRLRRQYDRVSRRLPRDRRPLGGLPVALRGGPVAARPRPVAGRTDAACVRRWCPRPRPGAVPSVDAGTDRCGDRTAPSGATNRPRRIPSGARSRQPFAVRSTAHRTRGSAVLLPACATVGLPIAPWVTLVRPYRRRRGET